MGLMAALRAQGLLSHDSYARPPPLGVKRGAPLEEFTKSPSSRSTHRSMARHVDAVSYNLPRRPSAAQIGRFQADAFLFSLGFARRRTHCAIEDDFNMSAGLPTPASGRLETSGLGSVDADAGELDVLHALGESQRGAMYFSKLCNLLHHRRFRVAIFHIHQHDRLCSAVALPQAAQFRVEELG